RTRAAQALHRLTRRSSGSGRSSGSPKRRSCRSPQRRGDEVTPNLVLKTQGLHVEFPTPSGPLRAVDGVDLELHSGETHALVGESGCGKSTLARSLVRLQEITRGDAWVLGKSINARTDRRWLSRQVQVVFQDPDA